MAFEPSTFASACIMTGGSSIPAVLTGWITSAAMSIFFPELQATFPP